MDFSFTNTHGEHTHVNAFCPWPCVLVSGRTQAPGKQTPSKGRQRFLNRANLFQYRNTHTQGVLVMLPCSREIHLTNSRAQMLLLWLICRTVSLAKCCAKCLPPVVYSSLPSNLQVYWKALLQLPYCRPHTVSTSSIIFPTVMRLGKPWGFIITSGHIPASVNDISSCIMIITSCRHKKSLKPVILLHHRHLSVRGGLQT